MTEERKPWSFEFDEEPTSRKGSGVYAETLRAFLKSERSSARVTLLDEKTGKEKPAPTVFAGLKKARETSPQEFSGLRISRRSGSVFLSLSDEPNE